MSGEVTLKHLIFNKMSIEKYNELKDAGELSPNEFYLTPEQQDTVPTEGSKHNITSGAVFDALADLSSKTSKSEGALQEVINEESARASKAEEAIASNLANEIKRASKAEEAIASNLANEIKRASKAEATLDEAKADKATTLAGYGIEDAYTKDEVDAKVKGGLNYKGTVYSYADLPTEDNVEGDIWKVKLGDSEHGILANDFVVWTSESEESEPSWSRLSGDIDLSSYYTKDEVDTELAKKEDVITGSITSVLKDDLIINRVVISNSEGKIDVSDITTTELSFLKNATSNIQSQLDTKAPLESPTFTGTPTAPTATTGDSSKQIATTEFVATAISIFDPLPSQEGNEGKILSTNGTTTSWIPNTEVTFKHWENEGD